MVGCKVVLLMDNFSAHATTLKELEPPLQYTKVVFLPPNSTSKMQPLDRGIIRVFKAQYKKQWLQYMLQEFEEERDPSKTFNLLKAIRYMVQAWQAVSQQTIANCWLYSEVNGRHFGPATELQAAAIWVQPKTCVNALLMVPEVWSSEGTHQEVIVDIQQSLRELQEQQHVRHAMAIDMLLNNVDKIVEDSEHDLEQSIIDSFSPPEVQESDDEGVEVLEQITADQALIMLQRLRLYEEQSDNGNKKLIDQLYRHERVVEARRVKGLHQRTLTSFYKL